MTSESNSESLFDTKLTSDGASDTASAPALETILPEVETNTALITFRVLISTKEAGIIIGKNGSCVAHVRERTGVKSGVSKVIMGCSDRILTVSGPIDATAEALSLFADALLESPITRQQTYQYFPLKSLCPPPAPDQTSLRLLIPHSQMGTLIGKQGSRIKALQESFDVKMVASKDFLPDSTERIVEVQGTPKNIESALKLIVRCLIEDWHGATGTVYYIPQPRRAKQQLDNFGQQQQPSPHHSRSRSQNFGNNRGGNPHYQSSNPSSTNDASLPQVSQSVSFESDYVGCLIGKKGSKIQDIRKHSGAQISIAQEDNEDDQRAFTITGTQYNVDKALSLLYQQIQREKVRRATFEDDEEQI